MDPGSVIALAILALVLYVIYVVVCSVISFLGSLFFPRKILAIDAEMVGAGSRGHIQMLARVSIVDKHCIVYDKYVAPVLPVTDYRTFVTGIRPGHLWDAESFVVVQREVRNIIKDCILIGHDIKHDLSVLGLTHPAADIRDTAFYGPFRMGSSTKHSLKFLARTFLGRIIQNGEHDSVEDARAAMDLYRLVEKDWEQSTQNL